MLDWLKAKYATATSGVRGRYFPCVIPFFILTLCDLGVLCDFVVSKILKPSPQRHRNSDFAQRQKWKMENGKWYMENNHGCCQICPSQPHTPGKSASPLHRFRVVCYHPASLFAERQEIAAIFELLIGRSRRPSLWIEHTLDSLVFNTDPPPRAGARRRRSYRIRSTEVSKN